MSNHSTVFDALGDPTRRAILAVLRDGPQPVGRLAERLPVGRPNVSKHLRVLTEAGLVRRRQIGTRHLYAVAPDGLAEAQRWLVELWDYALTSFADEVRRAQDDEDQENPCPSHR